MAVGQYSWKSTDELAQKGQVATVNTMAKAMGGTSPAAPTGTAVPGAAPAPAPSAGVSAFAMPKTMGEAMRAPAPSLQSNMGLAQENIQQGFQPLPTNGPADDLARNELQKTQDANQRATLEQSTLSGRGRTGQLGGDLVNYLSQSAIPQKMDLEAKLQTNRMASDNQRAQNAQGNLLGLANLDTQANLSREQMGLTERMGAADVASREKLGLAGISSQEKMQGKDIASKEKLGFADLSLRETALRQEASQFTDELSFKKYATDRGFTDAEAQRSWQAIQNEKEISSREKLGFADLSVREKGLAQDGAQFKEELAFKKYATDRGFTDAEAARVWQSKESDKEIASKEKISFASLSVQEKELAQKASQFTDQLAWDKEALRLGLDDKTADRVWQGSENQKEREARATDSNLNRELQKYLGDRGLDMDESQLAENIRQFDSKQDFDKWATQAGLDANAAELVWKSNEADVGRKWETGERMSTQEHQVYLSRLDSELESGRMALQQTLNLGTLEKQQAHDKVILDLENKYQTARDTTAMGHDERMAFIKQEYTAQLTQMGFDQETAMQAAEIQAKQFEGSQDREMQADMARAELAYKYNSLQSEIGLNQQEIQLKKDGLAQELTLGLKQLGLDETKIKAAITSQEFQDRAGTLATFMEISGDSPDAIDKATIGFLGLLRDQALMTPEEYDLAVAGVNVRPQQEADAAAAASTKKKKDIAKILSSGLSR